MSRRLWLGTPKGQYTSAITSFLTSRLTNTSFTTSAPTLSPTTYITQWYTPTPTSNITTTTFDTLFTDPGVDTEYSNTFVTNFPTSWVYAVSTAYDVTTLYTPTSNDTFKGNYNTSIDTILTPGTTEYTVPTAVQVLTPQGTVYTSYTPTNTTATVYTPTNTNVTYYYTYPTLYEVEVTRPTTYTSFVVIPLYRPTTYTQNTTVTGYFFTTYSTSNTTWAFTSSASGCYLYNVDGSPAGTSGDTVPSNCQIVACSPAGDTYSPGSVLTAYSYYRQTFYVSQYVSTVTSYYTYQSNYGVDFGQSDPDHGIPECYPSSDPAVVEYCKGYDARCEPCYIQLYTTVIQESYQSFPVSSTVFYNSGYTLDQYTTVSYLSASCLNCNLLCNTTQTVVEANPSGGYVPPSSRSTIYSRDTIYDNTTVTEYTPGTTTYDTSYYAPTQGEGYINRVTQYTGSTTYPTQYTQFTPGTTQYTSFTPVQETRFDPTTYTSFSTTLSSILEPTTYLTESGISTSYRNTDYTTTQSTSRTTTTTYLQNTGATAYEVPTTRETTTTYDTDYLTQQETSRDTEVITSWLTDDNVTTTFTTSRSTTWFTQ
jgi:hypothetical protein